MLPACPQPFKSGFRVEGFSVWINKIFCEELETGDDGVKLLKLLLHCQCNTIPSLLSSDFDPTGLKVCKNNFELIKPLNLIWSQSAVFIYIKVGKVIFFFFFKGAEIDVIPNPPLAWLTR